MEEPSPAEPRENRRRPRPSEDGNDYVPIYIGTTSSNIEDCEPLTLDKIMSPNRMLSINLLEEMNWPHIRAFSTQIHSPRTISVLPIPLIKKEPINDYNDYSVVKMYMLEDGTRTRERPAENAPSLILELTTSHQGHILRFYRSRNGNAITASCYINSSPVTICYWTTHTLRPNDVISIHYGEHHHILFRFFLDVNQRVPMVHPNDRNNTIKKIVYPSHHSSSTRRRRPRREETRAETRVEETRRNNNNDQSFFRIPMASIFDIIHDIVEAQIGRNRSQSSQALQTPVENFNWARDDLDSPFKKLVNADEPQTISQAVSQAVSQATECPICLDPVNVPVAVDSCGHVFCLKCVRKALAESSKCPKCRGDFKRSNPFTPCFGTQHLVNMYVLPTLGENELSARKIEGDESVKTATEAVKPPIIAEEA